MNTQELTVRTKLVTRGIAKASSIRDTSRAHTRADRRAARVVLVGNHVPRQCGIATFTADLCEAVGRELPNGNCSAVPVNDRPEGYAYPERVRFELIQDDLSTYTAAADFLNISNVDVVCLQHEYGIFGGRAGSHILALLRELRMPLVTTLHTVLKEPDAHQRTVMEEIADLSDRLVVMTHRGAEFLQDIYAIPSSKIDIIPHGIPDVPFVDPNFYKDQFGLEGKKVLLTFGLLSPNKGIEQGDVANIVFPCGYTLAPDGDTLNLYYGAADTCVAVATSSVGALIDWLQCHGRPSCQEADAW